MDAAEAEIVGHVRLAVELSPTHAVELAGLLSRHVSFFDFPWAKSIYEALERAGIREECVFTDNKHGPNIFLVRMQAVKRRTKTPKEN